MYSPFERSIREHQENIRPEIMQSSDILLLAVNHYLGNNENSRFAVVGPSVSLWVDPSLAFLSHSLSETKAQIIAIDPQSTGFIGNNMHPLLDHRIAGAGDIDKYFDSMRAFVDIGIPMNSPSHIQGANILRFCETDPVSCIIDHGTSPFVVSVGWMSKRGVEECSIELERIYTYYLSQLIEGGAVLLWTESQQGISGYGIGDSHLADILYSSGFSQVIQMDVFDYYTFAVPANSLEQILSSGIPSRYKELGYFDPTGDYVRGDGCDYLTIRVQGDRGIQHKSPYLTIAIK